MADPDSPFTALAKVDAIMRGDLPYCRVGSGLHKYCYYLCCFNLFGMQYDCYHPNGDWIGTIILHPTANERRARGDYQASQFWKVLPDPVRVLYTLIGSFVSGDITFRKPAEFKYGTAMARAITWAEYATLTYNPASPLHMAKEEEPLPAAAEEPSPSSFRLRRDDERYLFLIARIEQLFPDADVAKLPHRIADDVRKRRAALDKADRLAEEEGENAVSSSSSSMGHAK